MIQVLLESEWSAIFQVGEKLAMVKICPKICMVCTLISFCLFVDLSLQYVLLKLKKNG